MCYSSLVLAGLMSWITSMHKPFMTHKKLCECIVIEAPRQVVDVDCNQHLRRHFQSNLPYKFTLDIRLKLLLTYFSQYEQIRSIFILRLNEACKPSFYSICCLS